MALSVTNTTSYSAVPIPPSTNFEILGAYTGTETSEFQIRITAVGGLKFEWVQDKESASGSWSSEVTAVSGSNGGAYLADGISVGMTNIPSYWAVGDRVKFTFDKGTRKFNDLQVLTPDVGDTSIVGWSSSTGTFSTTKDNGLNQSSLLGYATSANNTISSLNHNSSLLYGFGADATSIPKRIGYQRYRQFNNSFKPNELFVENSVTNLPDNFTAPYDAEEIQITYYADASASAGNNHKLLCLIEKNTPFMHILYDNTTNYVYKETVLLNDYDITNPIAMTSDGVNIYILDNVASGVIHILRPQKTTDNASNWDTTWTSAFFNLPWNGYLQDSGYYSDILINKSNETTWESKLWVAVHKPYQQGKYVYKDGDNSLVYTADINNSGGHAIKNSLASLDIVVATNKIILTSRMPSVTNWFSRRTAGSSTVSYAGSYGVNRIVQSYEKSLIRMGDTANTVGWICNYAHTAKWLDGFDSDREMIMEQANGVFAIEGIVGDQGHIDNGTREVDYHIYAHLVVNVLADNASHGASRMKLPIKTQSNDVEYLTINGAFYLKDSFNAEYLYVYDENDIYHSKDISNLDFTKSYILESIWTGIAGAKTAFTSNDDLTGTMTNVVGNPGIETISNGYMNFSYTEGTGIDWTGNKGQIHFKYGFTKKYSATFESIYTPTDTQIIASNSINGTGYTNAVLALQNGTSNIVYTNHIDVTNPIDNIIINAALAQTLLTPSRVDNADGGAFSATNNNLDSDVVYYKYSYTYDGYQETQLSSPTVGLKQTSNTTDFDAQILVDILSTRPLSKRISHINIYRSHNKDSAEVSIPDEYFRLIKTIELKSNLFSLESNGYWRYTLDDKGRSGPTYEAITGIPETLENLQPHYTISTEGNGSMFIGNCWHYNLGSVPTYIFKSKVNRYNIYDWTSDFVILPEPPKELAFWAGKLFAFTENKTFQINPDTLSIEDTLEGTGAIASIVTDYGMFFCDNYTIYHHDGSQINNIGSLINSIDEPTAFNSRDLGYKPRLVFDARRKILCVIFKIKDLDISYAWAYSINGKRWDLWQIGFENDYPLGVTSNEKGEIIYSTRYGGLYKYLGGSAKRDWQWISKYITLGQNTIDKTFWKIRAITEGVVSVFYTLDNTNVVSLSNEKLASGSKNKGIKLKLVGTQGETNSTCDSIGLIYRRRPIK